MKRRLLALQISVCAAIVSCADVPKNRSDDHVPESMACITPSDPACVGSASALVRIPTDGGIKPLLGRCEMYLDDGSEPQPCTGIQLVVHSTREHEERTAVIDGFNFRIEDLQAGDYHVRAESPIYDLETDTKRLVNSGQTVKIRVRAKPRP